MKRSKVFYTAYTDGSSNNNIGGAAFIVINSKETEVVKMYKEHLPKATSNLAEMKALLRVLEWYKESKHSRYKLRVFTDSKYVKNSFMSWMHNWADGGWKKDIINKNTWKEIYSHRHNVEVSWVKAHNGNPWNTVVDYMANQARINR